MKQIGKKRNFERTSIEAYAVCSCSAACNCYCNCNCPADVPGALASARDGSSYGNMMGLNAGFGHSVLGGVYVQNNGRIDPTPLVLPY